MTEERQRLAQQLLKWHFQIESVGRRSGLGLRSPLGYTGLVLAGANAPEQAGPDRGILTGETLVEQDLSAMRLCVLSACETGLGALTEAEGVHGLMRAFHLAGCRDVVASLWQVQDRATAALMAKFYHELWAKKRPPLEALREAQLFVYRHPEQIEALAGLRGVPDLKKALEVDPWPVPQVLVPTAGGPARTPPRLWAAFFLSGTGR